MSEPKNCKHKWVREMVTYTTCPPQWDEICERCGLIERRHGSPIGTNRFEEIKSRFAARGNGEGEE